MELPTNDSELQTKDLRLKTSGSHWPILTIAFVVVFSIGAFAVGMFFGKYSPANFASTNTSSVNASDITGTLAIDWNTLSSVPQAREFNFYVRQWWEKSNSGQSAMSLTGQILGTVKSGPAAGEFLVAETVSNGEDLGSTTTTYYVLEQEKSDENPVILSAYSMSYGGFLRTGSWSPVDTAVSSDQVSFSDATIPELAYQPTVTSQDGKETFSFIGASELLSSMNYDVAGQPEVTKLADGTSLYGPRDPQNTTGTTFFYLSGELFSVSADGRALWYDLDIPFWKGADSKEAVTNPIAWDDGTSTTTDQYLKGAVGGCGFVSNTNVIAADQMPATVAAGHLTNDSTIIFYEPKDFSDPLVVNDYNSWKAMNDEKSITEFAKTHPFFYYKDGLGRWIKFTGVNDLPPGECGKPVIYLYPTKTMDLSVQLDPKGGFTKSEPAYGNGWNVTASPDGTIVNKADGLTYPYLFWEGRGGLYSSPDKYWVVAKQDVPTFLDATLAKLGLNAKETADFKEFWVPRMSTAPYYKIGFWGTSMMNQLAPMSLSTKPDTTIRILMDDVPLDRFEPSNPPKLGTAPARNGFTVVEWGGVLR